MSFAGHTDVPASVCGELAGRSSVFYRTKGPERQPKCNRFPHPAGCRRAGAQPPLPCGPHVVSRSAKNKPCSANDGSHFSTKAWVFGGGLAEDVDPVMVAGDGTITAGTYPQTKEFNGGFTVLDLPSREAALEWAAKIAAACRCAQEIREFMPDPAVGN